MIRTADRIDGRGMTGQLIDGRKIAGDLKAEVASEARDLKADGITAGIGTLLIGDDSPAQAYERRIGRTAAELGVT
jgi:methylenetetrahydrofolate dehydrogenase (NADP+) / methenyltetrahydrofolate cyclohydrolase